MQYMAITMIESNYINLYIDLDVLKVNAANEIHL